MSVRNLVIIHMNAGRNNVTKEGKAQISRPTPTLRQVKCLMASTSPIECNVVQESPHDIWYLDSGCSNHMTGTLNLFSSLDNSVQTDVTLGNNVQVNVLGKGTFDILTK